MSGWVVEGQARGQAREAAARGRGRDRVASCLGGWGGGNLWSGILEAAAELPCGSFLCRGASPRGRERRGPGSGARRGKGFSVRTCQAPESGVPTPCPRAREGGVSGAGRPGAGAPLAGGNGLFRSRSGQRPWPGPLLFVLRFRGARPGPGLGTRPASTFPGASG